MVYAIGMHDHCVMTVHLRPPTNVDLRVQHGVCYAVIMAWHGPLLHPHGKGMVNGRCHARTTMQADGSAVVSPCTCKIVFLLVRAIPFLHGGLRLLLDPPPPASRRPRASRVFKHHAALASCAV